jgi:hypothetical protein
MARSVLDIVIKAARAGVLTVGEAREFLGHSNAHRVAIIDDKSLGKHACFYCGGPEGAQTFDDSRGHCSACGGPRTEKKPEVRRRWIEYGVESTPGTAVEQASSAFLQAADAAKEYGVAVDKLAAGFEEFKASFGADFAGEIMRMGTVRHG